MAGFLRIISRANCYAAKNTNFMLVSDNLTNSRVRIVITTYFFECVSGHLCIKLRRCTVKGDFRRLSVIISPSHRKDALRLGNCHFRRFWAIVNLRYVDRASAERTRKDFFKVISDCK